MAPPAPAPGLAERYGTPSRTRRSALVALVALVAVAGLVWLGWVVLVHGRPEVSSQMVGFDVDGQHAATARFTVVRRDGVGPASCVLRAYADDHAVVGEVTVPVPEGAGTRTLSSTVRTERQATSVELVGCTAAGQRAPR